MKIQADDFLYVYQWDRELLGLRKPLYEFFFNRYLSNLPIIYDYTIENGYMKPATSLRKINTLKRIFKHYRMLLNTNIPALVLLNHEMYKPGGVEFLKLVEKYKIE
jgi:hypothetical protein